MYKATTFIKHLVVTYPFQTRNHIIYHFLGSLDEMISPTISSVIHIQSLKLFYDFSF